MFNVNTSKYGNFFFLNGDFQTVSSSYLPYTHIYIYTYIYIYNYLSSKRVESHSYVAFYKFIKLFNTTIKRHGFFLILKTFFHPPQKFLYWLQLLMFWFASSLSSKERFKETINFFKNYFFLTWSFAYHKRKKFFIAGFSLLFSMWMSWDFFKFKDY